MSDISLVLKVEVLDANGPRKPSIPSHFTYLYTSSQSNLYYAREESCERDRDRDRETERQRERETERQRDRQRKRDIETERDRKTGIEPFYLLW